MRVWYLFTVWLHLLAAAAWIGGMLFLGAILVPILRGRDFRHAVPSLLRRTGTRLRWAGWVLLGVLIATGILNLGFRGYTWADLWQGTLWQGTWGRLLGAKVLLVLLVLAVGAVHDFYLGPRATQALQVAPDGEEARRLRRTASWIGRLTLLLSLVILALAVMLVRGGV